MKIHTTDWVRRTLCGACVIALPSAQAAFAQAATTRVSESSTGIEGNSYSAYPNLSADGRWAVFASAASNLVAGDTNGYDDVFQHDRLTGATTRVSLTNLGAQANSASFGPVQTTDGLHVAFFSAATNLVSGDTNAANDVFVRDLAAAQTLRVSRSSAGVQGNKDSDDPAFAASGRYVAFSSLATNLVSGDTNGAYDVFVHDLQTGQTARMSRNTAGTQGNDASYRPTISADGRYVAFLSYATNLVAGDTNGVADVFVRDRVANLTFRASVGDSGQEGDSASDLGAISGDGRWLAFTSLASNLVSGDTNACPDAFLRDLVGLTTVRVNVSSAGAQANGESSGSIAISADGRFVAFTSLASNLSTRDSNGLNDVYVHDAASGVTALASVSTQGVNANAGPWPGISISGDGRAVAFWTGASNLVPGDGNGWEDVFVRDRGPDPVVYCTAKVNSLGCLPRIEWSGIPSAGATQGFSVTVTQILNNKSGLLIYGFSGRAALPFAGGYLCLKGPIKRTLTQDSGGNPPPNDCSGTLTLDLNAFASGALGGKPPVELSTPGQVVDCQYWSRDPGFAPPDNVSLSDAVEYFVGI